MNRAHALLLVPACCLAFLGCEAEKPIMVPTRAPATIDEPSLHRCWDRNYEDFHREDGGILASVATSGLE